MGLFKRKEKTKIDDSNSITLKEYKKNCTDENYTPGWQAIEDAFSEVYGNQVPEHFGTLITSRASLGGTEYLDGYSIYQSSKGYYHIVTFGMSQLYSDPDCFGKEFSNWGYEMTFKLKANTIDECHFAMNMLGNLARYTYQSNNYFSENEYVLGNGEPLKLDSDSKLCSLLIVKDSEIKGKETVHGKLDFLQLVGITFEDAKKIQEDGTHACVRNVLDIIRKDNPDFITDMSSTECYL